MDMMVFAKALDEFGEIDPELQLPTLLTFLVIARRGVCTQKEVESELGMTSASASRNVTFWTDTKRDGTPGPAFVERSEDKQDRRYKVLRLTPKGRAFYERLREMHTPTRRR